MIDSKTTIIIHVSSLLHLQLYAADNDNITIPVIILKQL